MTCTALCAGVVERAPDAQPGVGAVRINLTEGEVVIGYVPTRVSQDHLLEAETAIGFDVGDAAGRGGQRPDEDDAKLSTLD